MRLALALLFMWFASLAAAETSKAAQWLADEQIAQGCLSKQGAFTAEGLREIDLNGDGRADLILDHAGLECAGDMGFRSMFCGAQVCSVYLYIRNDDGLLVYNNEVLGSITEVRGTPPVLSGFGHGGTPWAIQWQGSGFDVVN